MPDKQSFQIDKSINRLFDNYKYFDEIMLVMDFNGNVIASDRDSFTIEFFRKFICQRFNFFKIIDSTYRRILHKRIAELKNGESVPPTEYKLTMINRLWAYVQVFSMATVYNGQPAIVALVRDITVRKEVEKKLLYSVVQTEEKERQRFAQDLHDELGPFLSGLKLYLHELNSHDINSQQKKKLLEYLGKMTNEAVDKIRSISSNLMPQNMIETGLAGNLEKTINSLNKTSNLKISLKTTGSESHLEDSFIITVYRMVLELINNSLKHSGAKKVDIRLDFKKNSVNLVFKDNGKGFDLNKAMKKNQGIGIKSIMNRIDMFHGNYKFTSEPNKGIEFDIRFKLK